MASNELASVVNDYLSLKKKCFQIKSQQLEALSNVLKGYDTLCILPTGFGKSLIYQLLPFAFRHIKKEEPCNPVVVVLSPYLSIISDQVKSANSSDFDLKSCSLDIKNFSRISSGEYSLIFGTPESWLENKKWRDMLSNTFFSSNLVCIVIDEVHKVSWGAKDVEKPFRQIFGELSIIRSVACENIPCLCLSATVDANLTDLIIQSCSLSSNLQIISSYPDRSNIKLSIVPMKKKNFTMLEWILELLVTKTFSSPRFLIYCRSVSLVGWLYVKFLKSLTPKLNVKTVKSLIGMYHCMTFDHKKKAILDSLSLPNSNLRLVIATSSLGCGVNTLGVKYVVHFGPAFELVDYCQQIGRAGRNCEDQCHAILYTFSGGKSKISTNMKNYMKSEKCLRSTLYSPFNDETVQPLHPGHLCCSICAKKCDCGLSNCGIEIFVNINQIKDTPVAIRDVSLEQKNLVKELLLELRSNLFSSSIFTSAQIASGLPDFVIEEIINVLPYANSIEHLDENTSITEMSIMKEVLVIIQEIFEDFVFDTNISKENSLILPCLAEQNIFLSESEDSFFDSDSELSDFEFS